MAFSRRSVLVQGGVIGAGLIASDVPGFRALVWATGEPTRKSLAGLAWNDPIVSAYRDAVGIMKATTSLDVLSWDQLGRTHKGYCPHGNWYFLPWHRAFVVSIERIVRALTSTADFAMPYWDWTANPEFPEVFRPEKTPDNKPNHLYVSTRTWDMRVPFPPNVVGKTDVLDKILLATPFEAFGTSRPKGQDSLDPLWIRNKTKGTQGILEATPHNTIHNQIGGFMPTMLSPLDPIFMMHHGNIDRIWAVWNSGGNVNSDETNWKDMPFTNNFYNANKSFWSPKVSDLFDPAALGYAYGLSEGAAEEPSPRLLSLNSKLSTVFAGPVAAKTAGIKSFVKRLTAKPSRRLDLAVAIDAASLAAVARRSPVSPALSTVRARVEANASGPRAYAFIRDVTASSPKNAEYRVFIKGKDITPATPTNNPHYVGLFEIFEGDLMGGPDMGKDLPNFLVDLTDAIVAVYGGIAKMPKDLALVIFAVPNASGEDPGTVSAGSIEIVIVSP